MSEFEPISQPPIQPENRGRIVTGAFKHLSNAVSALGDRYMLFVGICAVAYILGGAVPFYLIFGPMMCGMFYCFREQERGEAVEFSMLFKGFDSMGKSIIPALAMFGVTLLFLIPMQVMQFVLMAADSQRDQEAAFFIIIMIVPVAIIVTLIAQAVLFFAFPLIMDRDLGGVAAIKESFAAFRKNALPVLIGLLLFFVVQMLGFLLCCIGWLFVLPLVAFAQWKMYREVYPDLGIHESTESSPEPTDWSSAPRQ